MTLWVWYLKRFLLFYLSHLLIVGFLFDLLFNPEDGGAMFLRNACGLIPNYTALYSRKSCYSFPIFQFVLNVGGQLHIPHMLNKQPVLQKMTNHSGRAIWGMNRLCPLEHWVVGSNPTRGKDVCVHLFCVSIVLCVGSGLATGWSPVQRVLPTAYELRNWKSGQGPQRL
jgi:hypothetical protein